MTYPARKLPILSVTAIVAALVLSGAKAYKPQTAPTTAITTPTARSIPIEELYRAFLNHEEHLRQLEADGPASDLRPARFREQLRKQAGLSPQQWQLVDESGQRLQAAMKPLEKQARTLIELDRQARAAGSFPNGSATPNHIQLKQLDAQRHDATVVEISRLETSLGPDATNTLRGFLKNSLATHVQHMTRGQAAATELIKAGAAQ